MAAALTGDRRSLARLLTIVEAGGPAFQAVAPAIFAACRGTRTVGLTGAPGAGKSSLTDALVTELRARETRVAVVAVDPSSPLSGGAILGDRVRLQERHALDDDVYMRSLASRGLLGGLSLAVPAVVRTLDATGWPVVLIETVGVGQSEIGIAAAADTTVVVVNPGWGDEVQASKAGLLEIADVLVVNKADRPAADATVRDLQRMLQLGGARRWTPVVVKTVATDGSGVADLWDAIERHQRHLESSGELGLRRAARHRTETHERAQSALTAALAFAERSGEGAELLDEIVAGHLDPVSGGELLARMAGIRAASRTGPV